jgi:hypothetical protein
MLGYLLLASIVVFVICLIGAVPLYITGSSEVPAVVPWLMLGSFVTGAISFTFMDKY